MSKFSYDSRVSCAILPHRGTFATYNALIEKSRGTSICFFSDDDLMDKDFLRNCHDTLIESNVDYVWSDAYFWDGAQTQSISTDCNFNAMLIRREALDQVQREYGHYFVPDLKQYADVVMLYRFRKLGFRSVHIQKPLAWWRVHKGQLTRQVTLRTILDHIHAKNLMEGASSKQTVAQLKWLVARRTGLEWAKKRSAR